MCMLPETDEESPSPLTWSLTNCSPAPSGFQKEPISRERKYTQSTILECEQCRFMESLKSSLITGWPCEGLRSGSVKREDLGLIFTADGQLVVTTLCVMNICTYRCMNLPFNRRERTSLHGVLFWWFPLIYSAFLSESHCIYLVRCFGKNDLHFIKIIIMKHATVKTNDYSIGVKYTLQLHFLSIEILGKYVHVHVPPVICNMQTIQCNMCPLFK